MSYQLFVRLGGSSPQLVEHQQEECSSTKSSGLVTPRPHRSAPRRSARVLVLVGEAMPVHVGGDARLAVAESPGHVGAVIIAGEPSVLDRLGDLALILAAVPAGTLGPQPAPARCPWSIASQCPSPALPGRQLRCYVLLAALWNNRKRRRSGTEPAHGQIQRPGRCAGRIHAQNDPVHLVVGEPAGRPGRCSDPAGSGDAWW